MIIETMKALLADSAYKPTMQDLLYTVGIVGIIVLTGIVECL